MEAGPRGADGNTGWWRRARSHGTGFLPPHALLLPIVAGLIQAGRVAVERRRLFVLLPFSLVAGLAGYWALPGEPEPLVFTTGTIIAILALGLALWLGSMAATRWCIQACAVWFGFCLLPLHGLAFGTVMLPFPVYGTYSAVVEEVLTGEGGAQRVIVSQLMPLETSRPTSIRRARVLLPTGIMLTMGDRFQAALRLAPVPGPVVPGAHDGQFHSYFTGVGAYGSVTSGFTLLERAEDPSLARAIQALRDTIGSRILAVLDGDTASIAQALVVGDQSGISDETRDVMAASGLAHIYSISGLHLSIVAGGIFWLLRLGLASVPALVAWPVKQIAAIGGIVAAVLYLLLAGGVDNVPAFRSTLMLALIFGAVLAGRRALTMRNVAVAAIVIILIDPSSVFRPSFQLSFAAVVGLIGVFELPRPEALHMPGLVHRVGTTIALTAWTSLIAGLATLLFSAYHFQQTAPLGVVGNVLALPFVSLVIMPFGVLSVLAMPFGLEAPFLSVMGWGIDRMVDVAETVAAWSHGWTGNPLLAVWTLAAGLFALAWFAFLDNRWRLAGPLLAAFIVLALGLENRPDILVSDTTQAVAITDGPAMALGSGRTGSFAVDVWSKRFQTDIGVSHSGARCDSLGCIVQTSRFSVAIVRNAAAFAEDCGAHDLLIARIDLPAFCRVSGTSIGPRELSAGGVHALIWSEDAGRFDIRPAIESLNRPWRIAPR
mgnify:CR=1 FL=1|jgi:ComEC/Rec2-related protein